MGWVSSSSVVLSSSNTRVSTALLTSTDDFVTLTRSKYDSLIQKIYSVFTSDTAILTHSGSYLASSSRSSWIINSDVSMHMISKSTIFSTLHTLIPLLLFFTACNFKSISGTSTLISLLTLSEVNYVPRFLLIFYL